MYKKIRTLGEQLESEHELDLSTDHHLIDMYGENIGKVIGFFPKERYSGAILIVVDVNDCRQIVTHETSDSFLETYSPDDTNDESKGFLELKDVFIATKLDEYDEVDKVLDTFRNLSNSVGGEFYPVLMARHIISLEKQLKEK